MTRPESIPQAWPSIRPQRRVRVALIAALLAASCLSLPAATIEPGDVTSTLGPGFFVDDVSTGGTDTDINHNATASFVRLFNGLLVPNQGPTRVVITGFGFFAHTSATANDADTISVTFTYLGTDQAVGGGDDVVIGTATGTYQFAGGGEYGFAFDTPLAADLDITGTRFRIQVKPLIDPPPGATDLALKIKTGTLISEPSLTGAKLSVAGVTAPLIHPGRVNLAKFQPVTVSSTSGQRIGAYVTDGVTGNDNRWQSSNTNWNTARVDFPFPVEVGSAQVFMGVDDTLPVANLSIQYLDGPTWITIPGASISGNTDVERNLVFTAPVTASSFRVLGQDAPLRIRELALYPPNGPGGYPPGTDLTLNLAYQRPAVASAHSAGNFPLKAVDGRAHTGSFWQTTSAGNNTLDVDLRVATKVGSVHLYSGSPGVSPLADFQLKQWDGSAWQAIPGGSVTGNTTADLSLSFPPVTTSRIRLEFTNPGTASIRELLVFPSNTGNSGYPLGTNLTGSGSIGDYDTYHDAFHQLRNPGSNRFVTVPSGGAPALDTAGLSTAQGQYQVLLNLSNGTYRLRNRATGNCLAGARLSKAAGLPLADEPYRALPHQDWILSPLGGGTFQLVNAWSGLAIDTEGGATSTGTALVQNTASASSTQRWEIVYSEKYPKKGVGGTGFAGPTEAKWVYNWGLTTSQALFPDNSFYPMHWGDFSWEIGSTQGPHWQHYPAWRRRADGIHYLGFNEPDRFDQSGQSLDPANPQTESAFDPDRTIAAAVGLWPRLQAMDQPLVSPVPASPTSNWFPDFYGAAENLGYRVDYTALHLYPGPGGGSSNGLISSLQDAYDDFDRPVWLTEFSFVDWGRNQSWSEEDNYQALAEFLWRAEGLPWLRKYALFVFTESAEWPQPANPWQNFTPAPRSNTYDLAGNLTAFGKLYAAWDNDTTVRTDKTYYIHHRQFHKRLANNPSTTNLAGRNIRIEGDIVHWRLLPVGSPDRYYIVSSLDGRRLGSNGTSASFSPAGTTGTAVEWSLTESQHGWFYLGHPSSGKRLQLTSFDNATNVSSFTMAAGTTTTDAVQWRFIVPPHEPAWTGAGGTAWSDPQSWAPDKPSSPSDRATFNRLSTDNLATVLDEPFHIAGIDVQDPAGPVSIGGTSTLTLGAQGIDLSAATRDLAITAPLVLSADQPWNVAAGRTLSVGGMTGAFNLTVSGQGTTVLGGAVDPLATITVAADSTLKTIAAAVLPSGPSAPVPSLQGTLDLHGTDQVVNQLAGSGVVDNTEAGPATLTLGANNAAGSLGTLVRNSGGPLALQKTGSGNLTLPLANTHSGGFTNNGSGHVLPQSAAAFGSGPVVMNGGTLYSTAASLAFANPLTLNGATLRLGGGGNKTLAWDGPVTSTGNSSMTLDGGTAGITINGALDIDSGTFSSAAGTITNFINGPVTGASGNLTVASGILQLAGPASFGGTTTVADNCFLRLTATGTLPANGSIVNNGTLTIRNTVNWVHQGSISGDGTASINLNTGTNATLAGNITGISSITANDPGTEATISGAIGGAAGVTVQSAVDANGNGATLRLGGPNSYTGATVVQRGRLVLAASNVLPDASAVSIGNATLDAATFTDSAGTLDPTGTARIHLGAGAALAFANSSGVSWSGGSLAITGSFVSGASIRFGNTAGGLTSTQLGLITVSGFPGPYSLNADGFLTAVVATPYGNWKTANATAGPMDADHDADGVQNGIEHFLGGTSSTTGFTPLPGLDTGGLSVTWTRSSGYSGNYGTDYFVETATSPAGPWAQVPEGTGPNTVTITGNQLTYTFPSDTRRFARLKVTGP